jgi:hypothetical protein
VVVEVIKSLLHRGQEHNASYFRDRRGSEIDLLLDRPDRLTAVEIKSSRTVASDFFDALERFAQWATSEAGVDRVDKVLVYGGDRRQRRARGLVIPWSAVSTHRW